MTVIRSDFTDFDLVGKRQVVRRREPGGRKGGLSDARGEGERGAYAHVNILRILMSSLSSFFNFSFLFLVLFCPPSFRRGLRLSNRRLKTCIDDHAQIPFEVFWCVIY